MNLRRVFVLLRHELSSAFSSFFFIFAVVVPIAITLIVALAFGSLFSESTRVGLYDAGESGLAADLEGESFVNASVYESPDALRDAVADGAVDLGVSIPADYDALLEAGDSPAIDLYVWGQSLANERALVSAAITTSVLDQSGQAANVNTISLGDGEEIPIETRMLPLIILMTVVIGGSLVPAGSLVDEKAKRTLFAVTTTPASLGDVFLAKGLMGTILSIVMSVVILVLNNAFGTQPLLLMFVLALGAMMTAAFGILLGVFVKDMNALFATVKAIGILLYAPAFVYLFPSLPQVIGQVFPTYYIVAPVMDISQNGASLSDVAPEVAILALLTAALVAGVAYVASAATKRELVAV